MTRLCLPPGIDDRAAIVADHFAVPHPRFRIDWLTHRPQQAQAVEFVFLWPLIPPLDESADCRGRGVENIHPVPVYDVPEPVRLRKIRRAFIHETGGAVLQRSVDDVAMARYPADICRTPERVLIPQIKHPLGGEIGSDR